jgi:3-isopropylmalate/(R)-2-methylmalate dehydratase small subunit
MIIPAKFLKTIKRTGLGVSLFNGLRYDAAGNENPDFVLNKSPYRGASVIVVGDNFGCGSSREHAPWAIRDYGIRCILSTSFADIFYNNCFKNGLLPIILPRPVIDLLMDDADKQMKIDVDLATQTITRASGEIISFTMDPSRKHCLINGLDDIGLTMQKLDKIIAFEKKRSTTQPWFDNAAQKYVLASV